MGQPIDSMYVEIVPEFKDFSTEVERGINRPLQSAEQVARGAVEDIEHAFRQLAEQVATVLSQVFERINVGFDEMTNHASGELESIGRHGQETGRVLDSTFSETGSRMSHSISRGADSVESRLRSMATGVQGMLSNAFGYVVGNVLMDGFSRIFEFGKDAVFGFNSQLESANIAFTTMLGSGKKAQSFLRDLQDFAKSTPFEFPDLVASSQQMLGMGIDAKNVIPYLTGLGDAVAAIGGNQDQINQVSLAFDQMAAKGKVDMGNLEQLMQGGVSNALQILADKYHVTTGQMIDMISQGKIMSSDALPKLIDGLEHGTQHVQALGGMMQQQSQTFAGAVSNIKDALTQMVATTFRPLFTWFEGKLTSLANWLNGSQFAGFIADIQRGFQQLKAWWDSSHIGDDLSQWLAKLKPETIEAVKSAFESLVKAVTEHKAELREVADVVGAGFMIIASKAIPMVIDGITLFVKALAKIVDVMNAVQLFVLGAFGAMLDAAVTAFGWVPDLGNKLKTAQAKFNEFKNNVNSTLSEIKNNLDIQINPVINKPNLVVDNQGSQIKLGRISAYASGGVIPAGSWAWVGEQGRELLGPVNHARQVIDHATSTRVAATPQSTAATRPSLTLTGGIHLHFEGNPTRQQAYDAGQAAARGINDVLTDPALQTYQRPRNLTDMRGSRI